MDIKNVTISTETKYENEDKDDDSLHVRSTPVDYLVIAVPVPGGKAIYELKIKNDFRKSLEKAVGLK